MTDLLTTSSTAGLYLEVQQFYARHMHLLDDGDAEGWAATFAADGVFEPPGGKPVRGREALVAAVTKGHAALREQGIRHRHWHGMVDVRPVDETHAEVRCYALVIATPLGGETTVHRACVCTDLLVRGPQGQWLVEHRSVTRDDLP